MKTKKNRGRQAHDALIAADAAALEAVAPYRETKAVRALSWYSELGDQPQMIALSGGLLALGVIRRDATMARAGARMLAAHALATFAKNFVKRRIDRRRPRNAQGGNKQKPKKGRSRAKAETSFPSGHSAGAVAVARAFGREYPRLGGPALGAAGLIALAQVPRFAHHPTDVGAGIAIGLAAEAAVGWLWPAPRRARDDQPSARRGEQPGVAQQSG